MVSRREQTKTQMMTYRKNMKKRNDKGMNYEISEKSKYLAWKFDKLNNLYFDPKKEKLFKKLEEKYENKN